jgi:hypothetical protein
MGEASLMRGGAGVEPSKRLKPAGPIPIRSAEARRKEVLVYVRGVRFIDVTAERARRTTRPHPGIRRAARGAPITGLQMLFDAVQGTAVVLQMFDTSDDMRAGGAVFAAMDPAETPGTRASVDMCELKLERSM